MNEMMMVGMAGLESASYTTILVCILATVLRLIGLIFR
jgi:hypothetical protein